MDTAPAVVARTPITQWAAAVVAPQWLDLGKDLDRVLALPDLAGLDVRLGRFNKPDAYERELCKRVLAAGKRLRIHSWTGLRDSSQGHSIADAVAGHSQGKALAEVAVQLGAEAAGANSERDVWRGPSGYANPKAVDYVRACAEGMAEVSAELGRIEVGLAVPAWHYQKADLDRDGDIDTAIPGETRDRYTRKGVMAYQVDDSPTIVEDAELRTALDRARKVWPEAPFSVWLGCGRVDDQGRVWGDYAAARAVLADRHAGVDEVVWYVGFGAIGQVLLGHPRHPALVEILPDIAGL